MIKTIYRQSHKFPPNRYWDENGAFFDKDQELLRRRFQKVKTDRTEIDFDNVPVLFSQSRKEEDTLRNLWRFKKVAGVIKAKDEFPEINIVHPLEDARRLMKDKNEWAFCDPYDINIDDDEDQIRCYCLDVNTHSIYQTWPMWCVWNRFIPGRPNRMRMKVCIDDWENSEPKRRGGKLRVLEDFVWCDVYTPEYPRILKADFSEITDEDIYSVRDLETQLPDGIKIAPVYKDKKGRGLFNFMPSYRSFIYDAWLHNEFDASRVLDIERTVMGLPIMRPKEEKAVDPLPPEKQFLPKAEEERIRKVAQLLGKSFDEVKKDIIIGRQHRDRDRKVVEERIAKQRKEYEKYQKFMEAAEAQQSSADVEKPAGKKK